MTEYFLSAEQRAALRWHLSTCIPASELSDAVDWIDGNCGFYKAWQDPVLALSLVQAGREHKLAFYHAASLRQMLADGRFPLFAESETLAEALDALLTRIAKLSQSADEVVGRRKGKRGPRSQNWRAGLIRAVFDAYPNGAAKKRVGSNFERTVGMALEFIGAPRPDDLHGMILKALK